MTPKRAKIRSPKNIVLEDFKPKKLENDEVELRPTYCGICGSDVHAYFGEHPFIDLPAVPGHEISARIGKVGDEVNGLQEGQKATFLPYIYCGNCHSCRNGRHNICENLTIIGAQTDGALSESFVIDSELVYTLSNDFDLKKAAMIEPLAVGVHAAKMAENLFGKKIVVLGTGTIGQLIVQVAEQAGASEILAIDISKHRLKQAESFGADYTLNSNKETINQKTIKSYLGEDGAEIVFEAVGIEETIEQAIEIVQKGGTIIAAGVFGETTEVKIGLVQDREINLQGSLTYLRKDFENSIDLIYNNKIQVKPLISDIFDLENVSKAFEVASSKEKERSPKTLVKI